MTDTCRRIFLSSALAVMLCGCFTGIESTPRITNADVDRAGVTREPAEQELMAAILPEPPASWRPGKRWLADSDRISIIFTAASGRTDSLQGSRLRLLGIEPYVGVAGDTLVELNFAADARTDTLHYRPGVTRTDLLTRRGMEIPFAIELAPVEKADSLLRGRTFYITTPNWRDASGHSAAGLRHVPVTIAAVRPGSERYPLQVLFTHGSDTTAYSILLTYGQGPATTRNFERMFAFDNPRLQYPRITDDTWDKIIHSQVAAGMSRDECRLALGAPASINRTGTNAGQYERWNYDNGIYLIFEDGILIRYRQ